jgi:hypothetical protein
MQKPGRKKAQTMDDYSEELNNKSEIVNLHFYLGSKI